MDSFEINKIVSGVLLGLMALMVGSLLGEYLVHSDKLAKPVLIVQGVSDAPTTEGPVAKPLKPIGPLLASANVEKGKASAKICTQCHNFEKGGPNKVGPNLWGIVGNKVAHAADYAYSTAFKEQKGTWDYEHLNKYLHSPRETIKGTKMSFAGIEDDQERADVIAYLRSLSDSPVPLPKS